VSLLTGHTGLWSLSLLAAINGGAQAFNMPAETGVLPELVPMHLLQDANALGSIVRNSAAIGGAALAGVLVAATSPGWAIMIDAASFAIAAVLVTGLPPLPPPQAGEGLLHELREGWREFVSRTWVWAIVVQFALVNMGISAALNVYAPVISKVDLGGPAAYGAITAGIGVGGVVGGLVMLRYSPRRPLVSATLGTTLMLILLGFLATRAPLYADVLAGGLAGIGIEVFSVIWAGALQRYIPGDKLSRVAAYDALGSIAFTPIGLVIAGPMASAFGGVHDAVWATAAVVGVPTAIVLAVPSIWRLGTED